MLSPDKTVEEDLSIDEAKNVSEDEKNKIISAKNVDSEDLDHDATGITYYRNRVGAFVNNQKCQMFIIFLIIVNSILMGVQTFDFVDDDTELLSIFNRIDLTFLIIFTVELCLQFFYNGFHLFFDGWLLFDFLVVVLSWLSELMGGGANLQVLRGFRIFRALRLITRVKAMRDIVNGLLCTIPRMGAIFFLLSICFYIFAVMFTNLYSEDGELYPDIESSNYFNRLDHSLFTLFQLLTMDGWVDITREFMINNQFAYIPFLIYVTIAGFIFFNLIIAVLVDAIADQNDEEEEKERQEEDDIFETKLDELKLAQEKTRHTIEYLIRQMQLNSRPAQLLEISHPNVILEDIYYDSTEKNSPTDSTNVFIKKPVF